MALLLYAALCKGLTIEQPLPSRLSFVFLQNFAWPRRGGFVEGWSLSVEEWYYAIFIALCFGLISLGRLRAMIVSALVLMLVAFAYRAGNYWQGSGTGVWTWVDNVQEVVLSRLDAPAVGVLAAVSLEYRPELWRSRRVAAFAFVLGLGGTWGLTNYAVSTINYQEWTLAKPGLFYFVPTLEAVAWGLLLVPAAHLPNVGGVAGVVVRQVARSAYSIYLTHLSIVAFLLNPVLSGGSVLGFVLISAFVSQAFYLAVERPSLNLRSKVSALFAQPVPRPAF